MTFRPAHRRSPYQQLRRQILGAYKPPPAGGPHTDGGDMSTLDLDATMRWIGDVAKQRDEARAEVERLRAAVERVRALADEADRRCADATPPSFPSTGKGSLTSAQVRAALAAVSTPDGTPTGE